MLSWGSRAVWRETTYTSSFKQVEAYDSGAASAGGSSDHGGRCLGVRQCEIGAEIELVKCAQGERSQSLVSWDGPKVPFTTKKVYGALRSNSCDGLCLVPRGGRVVLAPCEGAAMHIWGRSFLD